MVRVQGSSLGDGEKNIHHIVCIYVTGGMFMSNGTTSVPKSFPCLVLDKVRLLFSSETYKMINLSFCIVSFIIFYCFVLFYIACFISFLSRLNKTIFIDHSKLPFIDFHRSLALSCKKLGIERAGSMTFAQMKTFKKSTPCRTSCKKLFPTAKSSLPSAIIVIY